MSVTLDVYRDAQRVPDDKIAVGLINAINAVFDVSDTGIKEKYNFNASDLHELYKNYSASKRQLLQAAFRCYYVLKFPGDVQPTEIDPHCEEIIKGLWHIQNKIVPPEKERWRKEDERWRAAVQLRDAQKEEAATAEEDENEDEQEEEAATAEEEEKDEQQADEELERQLQLPDALWTEEA